MIFTLLRSTGLILCFIWFITKSNVHGYRCSYNDSPKGRATQMPNWNFPVWKNYRIPYRFQHDYPEDLKKTFRYAASRIHRVSCVLFVHEPKVQEPTRFLHVKHEVIDHGVGGAVGHCKKQEKCYRYLLIQTSYKDNHNRKESIGVMLHEMFHALGIAHTQKRPDRDDHISIHSDNINKTIEYAEYQFEKCKDCKNHNIPYDCGSLMHYEPWAFVKLDRYWKCKDDKDKNSCSITGKSTKCQKQLWKKHNHMTKNDIDMLNAIYSSCPKNRCYKRCQKRYSEDKSCLCGPQCHFFYNNCCEDYEDACFPWTK